MFSTPRECDKQLQTSGVMQVTIYLSKAHI